MRGGDGSPILFALLLVIIVVDRFHLNGSRHFKLLRCLLVRLVFEVDCVHLRGLCLLLSSLKRFHQLLVQFGKLSLFEWVLRCLIEFGLFEWIFEWVFSLCYLSLLRSFNDFWLLLLNGLLLSIVFLQIFLLLDFERSLPLALRSVRVCIIKWLLLFLLLRGDRIVDCDPLKDAVDVVPVGLDPESCRRYGSVVLLRDCLLRRVLLRSQALKLLLLFDNLLLSCFQLRLYLRDLLLVRRLLRLQIG